MLGALYSSISGLKAHQTKMNIVGNNISNVNTTGFKRSSANFEETMTQTLRAASGPMQGRGGVNPATIGLGTRLSSINTNFESGAQQTTGRKTDLRIDGTGFFVVNEGEKTFYTRSGNFNLDGDGSLVMPNGMKVQGWSASEREDGSLGVDSASPLGDLRIKLGSALPGRATTGVSYTGNLNQAAGITNMTLSVDDLTGQKVDVTIKFDYNDSDKKWNWRAEGQGVVGYGAFQLDDKGNITKSFPNETLPIQNANGVLIQHPQAGKIAFSEFADPNNKKVANAADNVFITSAEVYDSLGNTHSMGLKYTKLSENIWQWKADIANGEKLQNGRGFLTFDAGGQISGNYLAADPANADSLPEGVTDFYYVGGRTDATGNFTFGNPAAQYSLDNNGVVKFIGQEGPGTPRLGQIMNKQYTGSVTFDPSDNGSAPPPSKGASPVSIDVNFGGLTQFASDTTATLESQNGYGMGELETFNINGTGEITGFYSNGYQQTIGKVAVSKFTNQEGLQNVGGSLFMQTNNSGEPMVVAAGTAGAGKMVAGALEMSNVDLAQEFTDMIIAQRGFQANSKTISASDQILQDLINLKR